MVDQREVELLTAMDAVAAAVDSALKTLLSVPERLRTAGVLAAVDILAAELAAMQAPMTPLSMQSNPSVSSMSSIQSSVRMGHTPHSLVSDAVRPYSLSRHSSVTPLVATHSGSPAASEAQSDAPDYASVNSSAVGATRSSVPDPAGGQAPSQLLSPQSPSTPSADASDAAQYASDASDGPCRTSIESNDTASIHDLPRSATKLKRRSAQYHKRRPTSPLKFDAQQLPAVTTSVSDPALSAIPSASSADAAVPLASASADAIHTVGAVDVSKLTIESAVKQPTLKHDSGIQLEVPPRSSSTASSLATPQLPSASVSNPTLHSYAMEGSSASVRVAGYPGHDSTGSFTLNRGGSSISLNDADTIGRMTLRRALTTVRRGRAAKEAKEAAANTSPLSTRPIVAAPTSAEAPQVAADPAPIPPTPQPVPAKTPQASFVAVSGDIPLSKVLFSAHDVDDSGGISAHEFKTLVYSMGYYLDETEAAVAIATLDGGHKGEISYDEFLKWWTSDNRFKRLQLSEEQTAAVQSATEFFQHFDRDEKGYVDETEFQSMYAYLSGLPGYFPPGTTLEQALGQLRGPNDDYVSFNDYITWLLRIGSIKTGHMAA
ncbi:hypothetical protein BC831DRAFT_463787 [Entophlyctis helioformis]|nr:hypothetical protein BC831DRAFT_463787 [Entophlyctis helioformis]